MKTCSLCGKKKPLDRFYFESHGNRYRANCKECHKAAMRPRSKSHYQANRAYYRERNRKQREMVRDMIDSAKNRPCLDCKRRFPPYVMDFDHVRGDKKFNVSRAHTVGINALREEMAKCDVVCSNCHRIRTHKRRIANVRRRARTSGLPAHHAGRSAN